MRFLSVPDNEQAFSIRSEYSTDTTPPDYGIQVTVPAGFQSFTAASGAISTEVSCTNIAAASAATVTLADGQIGGQFKRVSMVADNGDVTLTIADPATSQNTVTFADVGDTVELVWTANGWVVFDKYNRASGDAGPALSTV